MSLTDASARFDLYGKIHKAVRRAMFRSIERLGAADLTRSEEASAVCAELRELLGFLTRHGEHEDQFVHEPLASKLPGFFEPFAREHADQDREMNELEALCREIEQAAPDRRPALGFALYQRLALFLAGFLRHIAAEEEQINPKLWELFTDEQLMEIQGRILASQSPSESTTALRLMLPAVNPQERAALLGAVRAMAPPEVFSGVCGLAQSVLSDASWSRLSRDLGFAEEGVARAAPAAV